MWMPRSCTWKRLLKKGFGGGWTGAAWAGSRAGAVVLFRGGAGAAGARVPGCRARELSGGGGGGPGAAGAGEVVAEQGGQVDGGGAGLEPGFVLGGAAVAELEAAAAAGGDLGDGPLDVRPGGAVVLAQGAVFGPVAAGGAQQLVAGVDVDQAAGLGGGAAGAQRAAAAGRAEAGDAAGRDGAGEAGRASHGAGLVVDGEVSGGEPAGHGGGLERLGLDDRGVPGGRDHRAQFPGPVGRVGVPGQRPAPGVLARAAAVPLAALVLLVLSGREPGGGPGVGAAPAAGHGQVLAGDDPGGRPGRQVRPAPVGAGVPVLAGMPGFRVDLGDDPVPGHLRRDLPPPAGA